MIQHFVNRQHPRYVSIRCIFIQLGLTYKEVYLLETDNGLSEIRSSTIALSQPVCWTVEQDTEAHDDRLLGQKQRRLCCSWHAGAATYCTLFTQIIHRAAFSQPQTPVRKLVLILC